MAEIKSIRRMSAPEATAAARELALAYAESHGIEGALLDVRPDNFETERKGKTQVHWVAVFESVLKGQVFDGPLVLKVNLETRSVSAYESP